MEEIDRPSFDNFLSKPGTLTDHLMWQLGSVNLSPEIRAAAELVIGNLSEEGYLSASEDELLGVAQAQAETVVQTPEPASSNDHASSHLDDDTLADDTAIESSPAACDIESTTQR